ncbi:monocarboxylate transporter 14-like [Ctenocephalides felis]|uniref:monocarboxylate transporter 14-like n=2 Tax=Ctenocephalides felis TaxID=7515 RepID=UPI000E6E1811|nr:monocarboxylate transporter 14-like [Ctenocephalides felis]
MSSQKNTGAKGGRVRKISRTDSEVACEEAARLTAEAMQCAEEESMSYCEYHDVPPPPDGGYGWVVVFASFMCNMIVDGIAYTFGVFLGEFVLYFGEGKGKVAWVGSLLSGMYLSAGPVVSALTNKYGCRAVCIAGSLIASSAFVLSTFSGSVTTLMITYGVMGGIGFGLIYLPAVVCVGYYFETKRSLATGIAVCGSGFGTFTFAPLATLLLEHFDWRGANLILAGLILNCAVFGAMMRPLVYPKQSNVKPLLQRMAEEKRFQMERGSIGGSYFMVQLPDGSMEKRMKMPINIDPGVHSSFHLDELVGMPGTPMNNTLHTVATLPTISEAKVQEQSGSSGNSSNGSGEGEDTDAVKNSTRPARTESKDETASMFTSKTSLARERPQIVRPMSRKDIFYSGSVVNLPEYQSQKSLTNYRNSVVSLPRYARDMRDGRDIEKAEQYDLCPCLVIPESFKSALATMMDFSLLKDPVFMLIGISNVFGMAGLYVPFVYLVDAAVLDGIEQNSASFLLSIIGITNTVGRVACGYVADFPWVNSLLLNNICLVISTLAVAATPLCHTYTAYIIMSVFFGVAISGYISLTSIILVDLLGLDKLTNAFGLLILFRGAAAIIGSPLAGAVYDATNSYSIPFYMAGAFFAISTITSFMAPAMKRCVKPQDQPMYPEVLTPIDEDEEEEDEDDPITMVPRIVETCPSPMGQPEETLPRNNSSPREIKQIESVL